MLHEETLASLSHTHTHTHTHTNTHTHTHFYIFSSPNPNLIVVLEDLLLKSSESKYFLPCVIRGFITKGSSPNFASNIKRI